jgi:tetratricopeptide (TPR) repeat protein
MLRKLRSGLARFTVRRAAACQRHAPRRAGLWLRLGCTLTPVFAEPYPALVRLRRAIEDRWGALGAAQQATNRFSENPDAWMLLGEAYQMVYRQKDALAAYEQALALEERPDAAVAAGDLYRRTGRPAEAAARFARAYAAGGGAEALWLNAQALFLAGDDQAADEALHLWATQVPGGHEKLSDARAELRGGKRDGTL